MSQNKVDVTHVAKLACLELTPEESAHYTQVIEGILSHVANLQKYDIEGVEPTCHALPVFDRVREDVAKHGLDTEAALKNAPAQALDQIRVPKVVESA